jgi:uncharacterized protein YndB with AHSA1/START domain
VDATTESTSVVREIEIAARPETVWELLTDQNEVTRWMGQAAEFDLRPGGPYRIEVIPGNTARGEFVEIDAPRKLVYTWGWETGGGALDPSRRRVADDVVGDVRHRTFEVLVRPCAVVRERNVERSAAHDIPPVVHGSTPGSPPAATTTSRSK